METFSERLKVLKLHSGKTIEQCADEIGVSLTTFKHLLSGQCDNPRMDLLIRLSFYFNTTLEWLCFGDSPRVLSRQEMLYIHKFRQLPLEMQNEISSLIDKKYIEMERQCEYNHDYGARFQLRELSETLSVTTIKKIIKQVKEE